MRSLSWTSGTECHHHVQARQQLIFISVLISSPQNPTENIGSMIQSVQAHGSVERVTTQNMKPSLGSYFFMDLPRRWKQWYRDDVKNPKYLSTIMTSYKSQYHVLLSVQLPFCHLIVLCYCNFASARLGQINLCTKCEKHRVAGGDFLRLG